MFSKKFKECEYIIVFSIVVMLMAVLSAFSYYKSYDSGVIVNNSYDGNNKRLETDIGSYFFKREVFLDVNGRIRVVTGQRYINGVWLLKNNHMTDEQPYTEKTVLEDYAKELKGLDNYLKENGKKLLYVQAPSSVDKYSSLEFPYGFKDHSNEVADAFLNILDDSSIDNIDIRQIAYNDGINHYDMMYKTDHHWRLETGLYVTRCISDYLYERYGYEFDPLVLEEEHYSSINTPSSFWGSYGLRFGYPFVGKDDFTMLVPKFNTSISWKEGEGEWFDIMYYDDAYTYDGALNKLWENEFSNNLNNNGLKILITGNSFCKAVAPFMLLSCNMVKCHFMSLDYEEFDREYVDSFKPDLVIVINSPMALAEKSVGFRYEDFAEYR